MSSGDEDHSTLPDANEDERDLEEMAKQTWKQEQEEENASSTSAMNNNGDTEETQGTGTEGSAAMASAEEDEEEEPDFTETVSQAWQQEASAEKEWEKNVLTAFKEEGAVVAESEVVPSPPHKQAEPTSVSPAAGSRKLDMDAEPPTKKAPSMLEQPKPTSAPKSPVAPKVVHVVDVPASLPKPVLQSRGLYTSLGRKELAKRERDRQLAAAAFFKNELMPWMMSENTRKQAICNNENAQIKAEIVAREEQIRAQRLDRERRLQDQRHHSLVAFEESEKIRLAELEKQKIQVRARISEMDKRRREKEAQRLKLVSLLS